MVGGFSKMEPAVYGGVPTRSPRSGGCCSVKPGRNRMPTLPDFRLETYFARWEFSARYHLTASDAQTLPMFELLAMADDDGRERWESLALGYTETRGLPALREAIAATYSAAQADDVLCSRVPKRRSTWRCARCSSRPAYCSFQRACNRPSSPRPRRIASVSGSAGVVRMRLWRSGPTGWRSGGEGDQPTRVQVGPLAVSVTWTPSSVSSARRASARPQSRATRAASRSETS
jgi:hypothetical protein